MFFQLNKIFVLNFLNVHGKLFTKIGYVKLIECKMHVKFSSLYSKQNLKYLPSFYCRMESFEDVSCQMLQEFSALIQHTPPPIGNNRLLQLMCINMFAIDNCAPKG